MCIAMPAKIIDITPGVMPMAHATQGVRTIECCLAYVPEAKVGDYVLVQLGFAMQLLDEQSAAESLQAFADVDAKLDAAEAA